MLQVLDDLSLLTAGCSRQILVNPAWKAVQEGRQARLAKYEAGLNRMLLLVQGHYGAFSERFGPGRMRITDATPHSDLSRQPRRLSLDINSLEC